MQPEVTRPHFPEGYIVDPKSLLTWDHVEKRLSESIHYWLCSVRPDGRPHAVPRWAVYMDGKIFYDGSPETRHARNIARNPNVVLHLEDGSDVVIAEGAAREVLNPPPELGIELAKVYAEKYADLGYSPEPDQWDNGGLFEFSIQKVMAWTVFNEDPTRFTFAAD